MIPQDRPPSAGAARPRRRLALAALLGAVGVAVLAFPFRGTWWGGLILAVAEAGIVGGLADWFAVTALFRRPLGLPIPHTALIPANWELMAARVGTMVGNRVLTKDYVASEIARLDLAGLLGRAADRLTRHDLETATRRIARWAAAELPLEALDELGEHLRTFVQTRPVAPLVAWALEAAQREGWDRRIVAVLLQALVDALDRPALRRAVDDLVRDLLARYRERAGLYPRLWLGLAELLGLINRERIDAALREGLRQVAADPGHPLRRRLFAGLAALPARLRSDAALAARLEAAKAELLESPAVTGLLRDAAASLQRALSADLAAEPPTESAVAAWIVERLEDARRALIDDAGLRADLEAWVRRRVTELVDRQHARLAAFIEKGVRALGPAGAVRLIEDHAGDDLQYIRVNGTLVGGLAGGAIYGLHLLLRAF